MYNEYEREQKIIDKTEIEKNTELVISIIKTKEDLEMARKNYEFAENELIDYFLYQIKANQSKLDYLMKKAKDNDIMMSMIDEIDMKSKIAEWIFVQI